jgi:hypothetical protein
MSTPTYSGVSAEEHGNILSGELYVREGEHVHQFLIFVQMNLYIVGVRLEVKRMG